MKKWLLTLAVLALLLAGCDTNDVPTTTGDVPGNTANTTTVPETTGAPEIPGLYDPDAAVTAESGGALRAYPLGDKPYSGIAAMGDGILLLRTDYAGNTTLFLLTGEEGVITAEAALDCFVTMGDSGIRILDDGLIYYDGQDHSLVTLNESLQEVSRVRMPDDMVGMPVISGDGKQVYYYTDTQIRALDLQTGISRLLREQGGDLLNIAGLYYDDTVLKIYVDDADAAMQTQYLSTENGETVHYGDDALILFTQDGQFYAELNVAPLSELIFGEIGGEVKVLEPTGMRMWNAWMPEMNGAVSCASNDGSWTLSYYDLTTGRRTSSLTMQDTGSAWNAVADPAGNGVWFFYYDSLTSQQILCHWDPEKSAVNDSQVYTGRRYTAEDPDLAGIADCKAEAERIGEAYGVEILLWEDAVEIQPSDYILQPEHRVSAMKRALKTLEEAMGRFPEEFFQTAAENSDYGKIRIALVGGIYGSEEQGTFSSTDGIQFWYGSDPCIVLRLSGNVEMNFYHEMFHVIDTRVLGNTVIYDDWVKLNPKGFEYDYDYIANLDRTDDTYLQGENRAFVDFYSMSYPKEDRARIMEYAMMEGNQDVFESDWMQRKLQRLCRGIRRAFGLSKYPEELPWEQYLETSLVPGS